MEHDIDAIMRELDDLNTGWARKVKLTPEQEKVLFAARIDRKVPWAQVMEIWKREGWPGSETTLTKLVLAEESRRAGGK